MAKINRKDKSFKVCKAVVGDGKRFSNQFEILKRDSFNHGQKNKKSSGAKWLFAPDAFLFFVHD